jgi:hypothetical protein
MRRLIVVIVVFASVAVGEAQTPSDAELGKRVDLPRAKIVGASGGWDFCCHRTG